MSKICAEELLAHANKPGYLRCRALNSSHLATKFQLEQVGNSADIATLAPLSRLRGSSDGHLTYLADASFADVLKSISGAVVVTNKELATLVGTNAALVCETPYDTFYSIAAYLVRHDFYDTLKGNIHPRARIASTAVIGENVIIEEGAFISDYAVIAPNTFIGKNTVIRSHTSIGGNGFEIARIDGKRSVVPHAGGVWIEEDCEVASSSCIDKGLFGEFTFIGRETKIDNLVHVAHAVQIENGCSLTAGSQVAGSAHLCEGVWLGPHTSVVQHLTLGKYSYTGTGSAIVKDLPQYTWASGSPARPLGLTCPCRRKLSLVDGEAHCERCGIRLRVVNGIPEPI
ncbi:MAG: hypothetical protein K2W95_08075 [Candidatus Obscuribacterales bacterium]|nr:hypothetical protein [Candidatus Obscuribacterales bacterium]